ncbi:hypothetical protein [Agromyces mangrovi Wang et al. 2018]|uniref:hypothetical protein n=1 Tax=Agromyces mangrovi TaxID=1858653 RepID=UPI0025729316|nr:hypothetical protein [Agromyces mangrovi]BDZ66160.1 hypothetical protein GCM10025877_30980 [Agromyces mangrovi]
MHVQVVRIAECPGWELAGARLEAALDGIGLPDVPVEYVLVASEADAAELAFGGSPTILVDGVDLFPGAGRTTALACRVYPTERGLAPSPTSAQLAAALRERLGVGGRT